MKGAVCVALAAFCWGCGTSSGRDQALSTVRKWQQALADPRRDACDLVPSTAPGRSNIRHLAQIDHVSCEEALLRQAGRVPDDALGPLRILVFVDNVRGQGAVVHISPRPGADPPPSGGLQGINVSVSKPPGQRWRITTVGYEF